MTRFTRREFLKNTSAAAAVTEVTSRQGPSTFNAELSWEAHSASNKDIRELNQHFNRPGADLSPWMFVPQENIKELSTAHSPGLATVWPAGKGKDIKGILKEPIHIGDYPLPWEFQLAMVQNFSAMAGIKPQSNYAIGLNLAVTFSDPSTWPTDRTQMPPNTHTIQLLVVHLGGGSRGLPQYSHVPTPDVFLVWGRGDLHHTILGDWQIPYVWIGDGASYAGPASNEVFFRFVVRNAGSAERRPGAYTSASDIEANTGFPASAANLSIGIKFEAMHGWNMRDFDTLEFGKITGVWEIGPIISCDRWIPDELCRNLPMLRGPNALMLGGDPKDEWKNWIKVHTPKPEAPDPSFEQYVDYCVFMRSTPIPFEQMSDDFDIQGYMGQWETQDQSTLYETYSNPGYMTWTLWGPSQGAGIAPVGGDYMNLSAYKPPWEIEISFICPDDKIPWNLFMNFQPVTKSGRRFVWHPGVQNVPGDGHRYINTGVPGSTGKNVFQVEFAERVPESILSHKPLYMLLQWIDLTHVRVGFKAKSEDPWSLSKIYDYSQLTGGEELGDFAQMDWSTGTGKQWSVYPGGPMYQRVLIDYIHYRYGASA
jgi:hypothetical protein